MKDYQLWEAIGDIDDNLILETNEFDKLQAKRQARIVKTKLITGISLAACFLFAVLYVHGISYQTPSVEHEYIDVKIAEAVELIPTPAVQTEITDDENQQTRQYVGVKLNRGDSYTVAKFGGALEEATKEEWEEAFSSTEVELAGISEYYISFSEDEEALYGVLELSSENDAFLDVRVGKNVMLDSDYEQLSKTMINGVSMALGYVGQKNEQDEAQYYAIYKDGDITYTVEGKEQTLTDFLYALSKAVNSSENN